MSAQSSAATAVPSETVVMEVTAVNAGRVPEGAQPADGGVTDLVTVTGRVVDPERSSLPDGIVVSGAQRTVRLYGQAAEAVVPGAILTVVSVGRSVSGGEPTHLVHDLVLPSDLRNEALMQTVGANPRVPVVHLKQIEALLTRSAAPYAENGFASLQRWGITMEASRLPATGDLETTVYHLHFYSGSGQVSGEWELTADLDAGEIRDQVVWEEAPEPDPDG